MIKEKNITLAHLKHKDVFYFKSDKGKHLYEVVGDYFGGYSVTTRFICAVGSNNLRSFPVNYTVVISKAKT